ncbi:YncE family protein [Actinoplanes sp. N902-109]|uniref:YncE family protein n=1 Tax=Actinoplanes sp. (strain N902-109) TaxID=649831 RepID=UPI000329612D|nr:hypothetical protein [Actinoplanes sp. N902-109]AGL20894.1 hypothetical protein L083_7384 [Actinoplanes sp. N902-109]
MSKFVRTTSIRVVLAATVLAGAAALWTAATGSAAAEVTPIAVPESAGHPVASLQSVGDMVVDGRHKRILISDESDERIVALNYDGSAAGEISPGVPRGLLLSADATTLYATLRGETSIIAYDAATLTETARYPLGAGIVPEQLALAGHTLWFTYGQSFGSLDLTDGTVVTHEPLIDISGPLIAADHGRIAVTSGPGLSSGALYLFDATGTEIAHRDVDSRVQYHRDVAFTSGGDQVVVGGAGGYQTLSAADLSPVDTVETGRFVALGSDPAGGLMVAEKPDFDLPELTLLPGGNRQWDLPITGQYAPSLAALAWEPGGARLFTLTTDYLGRQTLWTVDGPASTATTAITLKAPTTATRAATLTISGTITGATSVPLTVTRKDAESATALNRVTTTATGTFTITDKPPVGGTVGYTVSYAGDAFHKPSTATVSVAVSRVTPTVTLNGNGSVNSYGFSYPLVAHLGTTYRNRTVEIWADPYGADQGNRLVKKATVDSKGNVSTTWKLTRNTTVSAIFTGDAQYAARTVTSTLYARPAVSTAVTKHYKTASSYYYFRKSVNPVFTTTMTAHPGRKQRLFLEYYASGTWHAWHNYLIAVDAAGHSTYTLTGTHNVGTRYRVRAAYLSGTSGDNVNYSTYGAYKYFQFTK